MTLLKPEQERSRSVQLILMQNTEITTMMTMMTAGREDECGFLRRGGYIVAVVTLEEAVELLTSRGRSAS